MRLYIAEKPSLARAIAAALPGPYQKGRGWIRCGSGDDAATVSWCIGHLLEPAEPGHYNPTWKPWRLEDLPLFPEHWQLVPKESVRQQLAVLESLIRQADTIIHAGDPDREGQLLVDEVLNHVGVRCPVQRVLLRDLTPSAVARALREPRDNREFQRLSHSALARQKADWLYGINLTRFYTLSYQQQGQQGVYSVGRVQTPVLGLVVQRDRTIENFTPTPYYRIDAGFTVPDTDAPVFTARWLPDEEAFRDSLDEENRLLDKTVAERIAAEVCGRPGTVTEAGFRDRAEAPPLPLSLSALQIEAARVYHMDARSVLDTAQSLYEQHQLITYPRSDCRYLPEEHFRQRQQILHAIAQVAPDLEDHCRGADSERRTAAWNDTQVDAHHAIIPTTRSRPKGRLSPAETRIYDLVCRYYLMQFAADAIHREGRLTVQVGSHHFRASESSLADPGWKRLELRRRDGQEAAAEKPPLPRLRHGDTVHCEQAQVNERKTQPPRHFTDATLLSAMTNIARFVADPELRRTLRETDGLGTEATRASIIETLFRRDYLFREGRFIRATDKGKMLIGALPDSVSTPDRTAIWEASLEAIRRGEGEPEAFLTRLQDEIRTLMDIRAPQSDGQTDNSHGQIHCPRCRAPMVEREGRFGPFRACSRYPRCTGTRPLEETQPQDGTSQKPIPCPHCFSPLVRRKGKKGWFWGCSNFPACRHTVNDIDGVPDVRLRKTT